MFGAVIGDSMALNTESLKTDECLFYYESLNLKLKDRIRDRLRCNFPANDWSSNSDLMVNNIDL